MKYRPRVGARKDRKIISAPLQTFSISIFLVAERERGLPEYGEREPEKEDEFEDKVEREPLHNIDEALKGGEKGKDDPILKIYVSHCYLHIHRFCCRSQTRWRLLV